MAEPSPQDPRAPLSRTELVSLLAMLSATIAMSIDAMLPAIPDIGADLSPADPNRAQLVVASFLLGLGFGTLFTGPLSDAYGRKRIAVAGAALFVAAALAAVLATSIEALLLARFVQGIGTAGPRVASMAIVRDLFSGRQMAQILSYIIFVFTLTPIFAPSLGWVIAWAFDWRAIFLAFAVFSIVSTAWLILRQPETLLPANRRPFRLSKLIQGAREVLTTRQVVLAMLVQTLIYSALFSTLMSSQQIFDIVFDRGNEFPLWFGLMGILSAGASLLNASVVVRLGMRLVVSRSLLAHGLFTLVFLVAQVTGTLDGLAMFAMTFLWFTSVFFLAAFGIGNMNALALEPMGHMAGLAASIITAVATFASALIAIPIGQAFDGTLRPLTFGTLVLIAGAFALVQMLRETPDAA